MSSFAKFFNDETFSDKVLLIKIKKCTQSTAKTKKRKTIDSIRSCASKIVLAIRGNVACVSRGLGRLHGGRTRGAGAKTE